MFQKKRYMKTGALKINNNSIVIESRMNNNIWHPFIDVQKMIDNTHSDLKLKVDIFDNGVIQPFTWSGINKVIRIDDNHYCHGDLHYVRLGDTIATVLVIDDDIIIEDINRIYCICYKDCKISSNVNDIDHPLWTIFKMFRHQIEEVD